MTKNGEGKTGKLESSVKIHLPTYALKVFLEAYFIDSLSKNLIPSGEHAVSELGSTPTKYVFFTNSRVILKFTENLVLMAG